MRLPHPCRVLRDRVGTQSARSYLFACPRANFLTLRFCDPRAYSRGLSGCSVLRFLRAARFTFLRSSLLSADVLAMNADVFLYGCWCRPCGTQSRSILPGTYVPGYPIPLLRDLVLGELFLCRTCAESTLAKG
jgi:hypothetical protein